MIFFTEGHKDAEIKPDKVSELVNALLEKLGDLDRVLVLPPDTTRMHSFAGEISCMIYEKLKERSHIRIMPTIGTHAPLTAGEMNSMFPGIPHELFIQHNWKKNLARLGTIAGEKVSELTGGLVDWEVHCDVNRILVDGNWDQIISVGQLVPHELIGIANHNKNVLIGAGGKEIIGKTHLLGALYGLEKLMGQVGSPVRRVLDHMSDHFLQDLPVKYILTIRGNDHTGRLITRGIFSGDDRECYLMGASLCQQVNVHLLDKAYKKVVTWMDPEKYKSTWVGNKAIYRTRMAVANGGELIILCPGIKTFGEDPDNDAFIRKYGYLETEKLLKATRENEDMNDNMTPLSHLIISSPEGRFKVIYAAKNLSRSDFESLNCHYEEYDEMIKKYNPAHLKDGENTMLDGEEILFISNPAQGLWTESNKFAEIDNR